MICRILQAFKYQNSSSQTQPIIVFTPWRRKWQPTPVFMPGKSHEREQLGRLQSMGSQTVGHNLVAEHAHSKLPLNFVFVIMVQRVSIYLTAICHFLPLITCNISMIHLVQWIHYLPKSTCYSDLLKFICLLQGDRVHFVDLSV